MLVKKEFVDFIVRIMSDDKCKANVDFLLHDGIYSFMYNIKTTELGQFPDLKIFHIDNFQVCTNIAIDMRLQSWNFNPKETNKVIRGYFFKPISLYRIKDIQVAQSLIPGKRQKQDDNWISITS